MAVSLAVVSCGDAAFTLVSTVNGQPMYLVISGNADDVAQMKGVCSDKCGADQLVDGDQHSGKLICEHDSSKNGHHLHFALYGSNITEAQCQQIFAPFP